MADFDIRNMGQSLEAQFRGLGGRHPGLWPVIPRILCAIATCIAVLALGWFFYWEGQVNQHDALVQEEQKLRADFETKIQQAINLDELRKQKGQVVLFVAALEKQLPSKAEMDKLLSDINQSGLGRGLQFELFKPGQSVVKDYYAELPIDIKILGNYHDIGDFASDIAKLPRIVTLNNMALAVGKDGNLTLDAVAKTFRYLDPEEVAAQRKAASAAKDKDKKGAKDAKGEKK